MAEEQMSLEGILGDEKPAPRETPVTTVEKPLPEIPVLGDKPIAEPVNDPVEKQQAERNKSSRQAHRDREQAAQGRVRDPETGQFLAKDAAPAEQEAKPAATPAPIAKVEEKPAVPAAPQQELTEKEKAFLKAAHEERGKRQELERRLAAIEAAKPKEPEKEFWDDPVEAIAKQRREFQEQLTAMRLGTSEQIARSRYPDFNEKVAKFSELAMATPGLAQQMLSHPDPATFAYNTAKNHMELQAAGGMEQMRANMKREITAHVRAELEAELKAKAEALEKARAAIPESLSAARATGPANRPIWSGPTPLDSILGKG